MTSKTKIVGILNVTPDSFSDGGNFFAPEHALNQAKKMIEEGAEVIDIGAESTRPNATPLTDAQEWERLLPILPSLIKIAKENNTQVSVDTRHPDTASKAIQLGVDWINDVSGCNDPQMIQLIKSNNVKLVVMHNLGVPVNPKIKIPDNENAVEVIFNWGKKKIAELINKGITQDKIIFDPGLGFGTTASQSLEIIKSINEFNKLNVPILVGHSRKSFLSLFTDKPFAERDLETSIVSAFLNSKNVDYIRVHNVRDSKRAVNIGRELL
jgi:dihydropteroate synthase